MSTLSALLATPSSSISYRICEPAPAKPVALLILLHGVGGNETNLAAIAAAAPTDTLVVLARGRIELGPGQYGWFRVAFAAAGPQIVASEADESRQALIQFVDAMQVQYDLAPARTAIAGFSQGGILSASVGLSSPESVKGFAVLSGRILPELEPVIASRARLSSLNALLVHGRSDAKLPLAWAERAHAWLMELGVQHELKIHLGGHGLSAPMVGDFAAWLQAVLTPPAARRMDLRLDANAFELTASPAGAPALRLAPGIDSLVHEYLAPARSLALGIENAIAAIEDELARAPATAHGARLTSSSSSLRDIATAAGLSPAAPVLHREAVEAVFARQSAEALGRPSASERLPTELVFVAGLLLLREMMHHLGIEAISLTA